MRGLLMGGKLRDPLALLRRNPTFVLVWRYTMRQQTLAFCRLRRASTRSQVTSPLPPRSRQPVCVSTGQLGRGPHQPQQCKTFPLALLSLDLPEPCPIILILSFCRLSTAQIWVANYAEIYITIRTACKARTLVVQASFYKLQGTTDDRQALQ